MAVTKEQILAALKKLGPSSPGALADHLEVDQLPGTLIKQLLDAKELKATGAARGRRIALPDQQFDAADAPPQQRKPKAGKKRKGPKAKKARKAPRARTADTPAPRFIPVVDAEKRLHIINGSEPVSFSDAQTEAIATLLFQHYAP